MQKMYNILLLGDTRVGKSALIHRFLHNQFEEDYIPTISIKLKDKSLQIDSKEILIQVVDTIGLKAEHDLPIISKTIQAADGVFVLFDMTCIKTQQMARFWFNEVRKQKENKHWMIVVGVGTKCEGNIQVDQDGIEAFSKECSAEMIITSAKTGFNVRECFETMTKKIIQIQRSTIIPTKKQTKKESSKISKAGKIDCDIY